LCRGIDLPLLLRQRNVQRSIRACLFSARALQSLLRRLHVLGQVIAVAAFMRLPTHTAARLVQAALDYVPRLPVPPAVCAAELSSLRLRHAAESCEPSQSTRHLRLDREHFDPRRRLLRRLARTCMRDMRLCLVAVVAARRSLVRALPHPRATGPVIRSRWQDRRLGMFDHGGLIERCPR